jgi:amino acid transporter
VAPPGSKRRPSYTYKAGVLTTLVYSLAEETHDPSHTVPRAIVFATAFTYVGGWLFNIALVFCMGEPKALISSRVGQPVRTHSPMCSLDEIFQA